MELWGTGVVFIGAVVTGVGLFIGWRTALARYSVRAQALQAAFNNILIEVQRSGRGSRVLMAAIIQASDFGEALLGANFQRWITEAGFRQLDVAKQNQRDLDQD